MIFMVLSGGSLIGRIGISSALVFGLGALVFLPFLQIIPGYTLILTCLVLLLTFHLFVLMYCHNNVVSFFWIFGILLYFYVASLGVFSRNYPLVGRFAIYLLIANLFQLAVLAREKRFVCSLASVANFLCYLNIITCITTITQLMLDPAAARMVSEVESLQRLNVGGYGFIYSQLGMLLVWSNRLRSSPLIGGKILNYFGFVFSLLVLLMSNYLIAVLLSLCVVGYLFIRSCHPFNDIGAGARLLVVGMVISGLVYYFFMSSNEEIYLLLKIIEVSLAVFSSGESVYLSERMLKYFASINGFLQFPVLGLLGNGEEVFNWDVYGRHSYTLDNFALLGFFGGLMFSIYLIAPVLNLKLMRVPIFLHHGGVILLILALVSTGNILSTEIILTFFFISVFVSVPRSCRLDARGDGNAKTGLRA